jgi:hypothetical protein
MGEYHCMLSRRGELVRRLGGPVCGPVERSAADRFRSVRTGPVSLQSASGPVTGPAPDRSTDRSGPRPVRQRTADRSGKPVRAVL